MRTFKRLFPIFLVPVLLVGVATARPAGVSRTSQSQFVAAPKSQFIHGYENPRFYFGTVVRDTADEQSVRPGPWQGPREVSVWTSFFTWSWFSLLIAK
jgi:hypothetical protein